MAILVNCSPGKLFLSIIPARYSNNYSENLKFLQGAYRDLYNRVRSSGVNLSLESTKDGSLTLKVRGVYLESKYSPEKNALRYINGQAAHGKTVLFFGSGLGYHINALIGRYNTPGVLIEKDLDVFNAALHVIEPQIFRSVVPLIGIGAEDLIKKISSLPFGKLSIVKHPQSIQVHREYYRLIEESINRKLKEWAASSVTERAMQRLWVRNILKNLGQFKISFYGTHQFEKLFNGPVLLAASGPFIEDITGELKTWSKKLPLFALLPSVPYLLKNGIQPDFIITTDAGFGNRYRFLRDLTVPLISTYSADTSILENWAGNIYLISHGLPLECNLGKVNKLNLCIPMQGTASSVMILLARLMGFTEIYLAGFDFAFRGLKDHHQGAGFDNFYLASSTRLKNWPTAVFSRLKRDRVISTDAQSGRRLKSSHKLLLYKQWLESEIISDDIFRLNDGAFMDKLKTASSNTLYSYDSKIKSEFLGKMRDTEKIRITKETVLDDIQKINLSIEKSGDIAEKSALYEVYRLFYGNLPDFVKIEDIRRDVAVAVRAFQKRYGCMEQ